MDRYQDLLFPQLAAAGIRVHAFDQRGWGRTVQQPAERGLTGPTAQVQADIRQFVAAHLDPDRPTFLMGHSMGGQNTAYFLSTAPAELRRQLAGFILSSPLIALGTAVRPPWGQVGAGRIVARWLPHAQKRNAMNEAWMSHDPVVNASWKADPLCHDTGTLQGLAGMIDRAQALDARTVTVARADDGLRLLLLHGDADVVCDCPAAQRWFDAAPLQHKRIEIFQDGYHCLFAEPEHKAKYVQDIIDFVKEGSAETAAQSKL